MVWMKWRRHSSVAIAAPLLLLAGAAHAQQADNAGMAAILAADQAVRSGPPVTAAEMARTDGERRMQTRALLDAGLLVTANDFYGAALVYQHGTVPSDLLLSHVLAVRAVALGHERGEWIAAASLDRYLQNTGQAQIYGSQYRVQANSGTATMEPYDKAMIPDSFRLAMKAPTIAEQESRLQQVEETARRLMQQAPSP